VLKFFVWLSKQSRRSGFGIPQRKGLAPLVYTVANLALARSLIEAWIALRRATSGSIWDIFTPENFKIFHSNSDIGRNFQRIKMKFWYFNHLEKSYLNFSLSYWSMISLQDLSYKISHAI